MNNLAVEAPVLPSVSMDDFRQGMRNLAGAVNVITVKKGDELAGLTATAVMSVSAEPPRVMVCVNQGVYAHGLIAKGGSLCINVLDPTQLNVAETFAGMNKDVSAEDRFTVGDWSFDELQAPKLEGALLNLRCRVVEITPASSHSMVLCEVEDIDYQEVEDKAALLYFDCEFSTVKKHKSTF